MVFRIGLGHEDLTEARFCLAECPQQAPIDSRKVAHLGTVAPPVPAHVVAERTRAARIIAKAPAGAEAERDEAIRAGISVETFESVFTVRAIVEAGRIARGRKFLVDRRLREP